MNATDEIDARNDPHIFLNRAPIADPNDFNRDSFVNGNDESAARSHSTNVLTALKVISVPGLPNGQIVSGTGEAWPSSSIPSGTTGVSSATLSRAAAGAGEFRLVYPFAGRDKHEYGDDKLRSPASWTATTAISSPSKSRSTGSGQVGAGVLVVAKPKPKPATKHDISSQVSASRVEIGSCRLRVLRLSRRSRPCHFHSCRQSASCVATTVDAPDGSTTACFFNRQPQKPYLKRMASVMSSIRNAPSRLMALSNIPQIAVLLTAIAVSLHSSPAEDLRRGNGSRAGDLQK